ncbi:hypothetical protein ACKVWC_003699 [Pyricularia oryzae]
MPASSSMDFSRLPAEIYHKIVRSCVLFRDLKRALRLRFVSRAFGVAVLDAIFDSWDLFSNDEVSFWLGSHITTPKLWVTDMFNKHFVHRILMPSALLNSVDVEIIRRVAEKIARQRLLLSEDSAATKPDWPRRLDAEYRRCVKEMCGWFRRCMPTCVDDLTLHQYMTSPLSYEICLIRTAAYLGELEITKRLLAQSSSPNIEDLAITAASSGSLDLVTSLVAHQTELPTLSLIGSLSRAALEASRMQVLKHLLDLAAQTSVDETSLEAATNFHQDLVCGCDSTRSLACFRLAYEYHLHFRSLDDYRTNCPWRKWEKAMLKSRCSLAACDGDVEFLGYFINAWPRQLARQDFLFRLVEYAARFNRFEALGFLVEKAHAKVRAAHIMIAMASGSVRVVELLLAYYLAESNRSCSGATEGNDLATQTHSLKDILYLGLLEASRREHDAVVRWGLAKSRELGGIDISDIVEWHRPSQQPSKAAEMGMDLMLDDWITDYND